MSDDEADVIGTDNPSFIHNGETLHDNNMSVTDSRYIHQDVKALNSEGNNIDHNNPYELTLTEKEKTSNSFISEQKNVECLTQSPGPTQSAVTGTEIHIPKDNLQTHKNKQNGTHEIRNNNDVSFLNSTVASVINSDISNKKEQIEAVNLELISMKPFAEINNLQIKNQEACELPADPYEEYFVPVNEHRKFIRGEKLYVTKDKRSTSSYWRKVFWWGCGFLMVVTAAIITILIGTGVILTQEVSQSLFNDERKTYQHFNNRNWVNNEKMFRNPPPSLSPIKSTFPPWHTTDETLYKFVPKALEGLIKLDNLEWNNDMYDLNSRFYRNVAKDIENSLSEMLSLNNDTPFVKVYLISENGNVKFRVHRPIFETPQDNQDYLENKFLQNGNIISKYHVNRLTINFLVDQCHTENLKCSDYCNYDYFEGIFRCTCPTGKSLEKNGKTCVNVNDLSNINFQQTLSENIQGRSRVIDDTYVLNNQLWRDLYPNTKLNSTSETIEKSTEDDDHPIKQKHNFHLEIKDDKEPFTESKSKIKISQAFKSLTNYSSKTGNSTEKIHKPELSAHHPISIDSANISRDQLIQCLQIKSISDCSKELKHNSDSFLLPKNKSISADECMSVACLEEAKLTKSVHDLKNGVHAKVDIENYDSSLRLPSYNGPIRNDLKNNFKSNTQTDNIEASIEQNRMLKELENINVEDHTTTNNETSVEPILQSTTQNNTHLTTEIALDIDSTTESQWIINLQELVTNAIGLVTVTEHSYKKLTSKKEVNSDPFTKKFVYENQSDTKQNINSMSSVEFTKEVTLHNKDEPNNPNSFNTKVKDVITTDESTKTSETTIMHNLSHNFLNSSNNSISLNTQYSNVISTSEKNNITNMNESKKLLTIRNNSHALDQENKLRNITKSEENVENQHNDITVESIQKGYIENDVKFSQDTKKDETKIKKNYKDYKNLEHTNSKVNMKNVDELLSNSTIITMIEDKSDHFEDPSMTSEVPILPIEIQIDMSTTESVDTFETQVNYLDIEKEVMLITNTPDSKTTEQIPTIPDELQTTETYQQDQFTSESSLAYQIKRFDNLSTNNEALVIQNENNSTSTNLEFTASNSNIANQILDKTTSDYTVLNKQQEPLLEDKIKSIYESISDDSTPQSFEYKFSVITTTENFELQVDLEKLIEDQLRVVPIEERDNFEKKLTSGNYQQKLTNKKELDYGRSNYSSEFEEFLNDEDKEMNKNIEDDISKLELENSNLEINSRNAEKAIKLSQNLSSNTNPNLQIKMELNTSTIKYPTFIPVSEKMDDSNFTGSTYLGIRDNLKKNSTNFIMIKEPLMNNENKKDWFNLKLDEFIHKKDKVEDSTISSKPAITEDNIGIAVTTLNFEDLLPQGFFSKCKSGEFQCLNGTSRDGAYCVNLSAKCDSENDCSDGSDESNCETEGCPGNFQCSTGQCLKRHLVCNGIIDCNDGTDEKECERWNCNFDEFQCPSGRCIPVLWQCNGRSDCENHTDEYSCSESCDNDEYLCPIEKWCIPQTWRCNGVSECVNGEDEKLCECAIDQFKCETGGCISAEHLCDGIENCPDRSDEWNCLSSFNTTSISTNIDKDKDYKISSRNKVIQIRKSSKDYKFICSIGWTEQFSDQYCRSLGFSSSESTRFINLSTQLIDQGAEYYLQLASNANPNSSLIINLKEITSCKSAKIVEVSCQDFPCGSQENVGPTSRIVGGTPTSEGQWSSVALLKESKHGITCTASILTPMHALASYSCIYSYRHSSEWQLYVGGNLIKSYNVKNVRPYPQVKYNQFLYNNDIALIEIVEPLKFSGNVSAVCLPSQSLQPRQLCVTVGWGFSDNGAIGLEQYLKFLPVPTYDTEECNARSHYAGFITKYNICAGSTDNETGLCYNDKGAPLMCVNETGKWEIQGLLSHHSRCSRVHPAIYSSLAPAISWLKNSVPALEVQS